MPGLTTAAFLALAVSCAPEVAPKTLLSIAKVESDLSPLAINDNTTKREYAPADKPQAVELATRLRSAGHNIDSGIMQVNIANWGWLGVSLEDTFDPCLNIRAGATELTSYSRYNTGSPTRGFANGYVDKVVRAAQQGKDLVVADAGASRAVPATLANPISDITITLKQLTAAARQGQRLCQSPCSIRLVTADQVAQQLSKEAP